MPGRRPVKGVARGQGLGKMSRWCSQMYGISRPNAEGLAEVEVLTQKGPWCALSRECPLCPAGGGRPVLLSP